MVSGLPKVFRVFRRGVVFGSRDIVERLIEGIVAVILEDFGSGLLCPQVAHYQDFHQARSGAGQQFYLPAPCHRHAQSFTSRP